MSQVIDVHTHMYSRAWLELLRRKGGPNLEVRESVDSPDTVYYRGASFCVLEEPHFDYPARVEAMDAAGVDVAVITLSAPNVFWGGESTSLEAAKVCNDEFAEAQSRFPDRIRWMASLPWEYPERATEELDRACNNGAVGVMVLGNINGRHLVDPLFEPVWAEIDRRGLAVLVHPTAPAGIDALELGPYALVASTGFMVDTTVAVSKMIFSGFFDTFPNVKLIAAHAGATLPYLAGRFDQVFERTGRAKESISKPPSEYLRHIYYDAVTYRREALELCVKVGGADHVMYGSDYPFNIGDMEGCLKRVNDLPESARDKVRGDNAKRIFGI